MKINVTLLLITLNFMIGSTDNTEESSEYENVSSDNIPLKPEKKTTNFKKVTKKYSSSESVNDDDNPSSSGPEEEYEMGKRLPLEVKTKNDKFWTHPLAMLPPWKNKEQEPVQSRYPVYDPSFPNWELGYPKRPGNKKNLFLYVPPKNDLSLDLENADRTKQMLSGYGDRVDDPNTISSSEIKRYIDEIKAGDMTQLLGTNLHIHQPSTYRIEDLGRRFVSQYHSKQGANNDPEENIENNSIIPKQASPELVLAVVKESALLEDSKPAKHTEELIKKEALRSGNYWNAYWKDDIADPTNALRTTKHDSMESFTTKLSPGTPIYEFVSKLNKSYPKLLYVINRNK